MAHSIAQGALPLSFNLRAATNRRGKQDFEFYPSHFRFLVLGTRIYASPRGRWGIIMIRFLANIFRGLSYVIGITAPPPGQNERPFVFWWLGGIVFVLAAIVVIFYVLARLGAP